MALWNFLSDRSGACRRAVAKRITSRAKANPPPPPPVCALNGSGRVVAGELGGARGRKQARLRPRAMTTGARPREPQRWAASASASDTSRRVHRNGDLATTSKVERQRRDGANNRRRLEDSRYARRGRVRRPLGDALLDEQDLVENRRHLSGIRAVLQQDREHHRPSPDVHQLLRALRGPHANGRRANATSFVVSERSRSSAERFLRAHLSRVSRGGAVAWWRVILGHTRSHSVAWWRVILGHTRSLSVGRSAGRLRACPRLGRRAAAVPARSGCSGIFSQRTNQMQDARIYSHD